MTVDIHYYVSVPYVAQWLGICVTYEVDLPAPPPAPTNLVHLAPSLVITVSHLAIIVVYVLPAFEMLLHLFLLLSWLVCSYSF